MLLEIDDSKTIDDIEERFMECFPLLKIEFYEKHKREDPDSPLKRNQYLVDIRKKYEPSILEINSDDRIQDILHELKKRYGLEARIFRKHKNKWQMVVKEEHLTIKEACELASVSNEENAEIIESICCLDPDKRGK